jgi:hypothetical protein
MHATPRCRHAKSCLTELRCELRRILHILAIPSVAVVGAVRDALQLLRFHWSHRACVLALAFVAMH